MPPALLFESSGQFRFVHRSQLNKRQTQVGYFNRKQIQLKRFHPSAETHSISRAHPHLPTNMLAAVLSIPFKSGWPSGLRRQTQGGVPSSVEGFLVSVWGRGFESHCCHGLLTSRS